MKYCFILNPAAGKGAFATEWGAKLHDQCREKSVSFEVYTTKCVGDATEYVKKTAEENPDEELYFYACGGDGTLCEVVNGVMSADDPDRLAVGLIPSGTGNDFARNFTQRELFFDVEAQLGATPARIDLIRANEMYAINMINIGFDCEVVVKTASLKKSPLIPSKFAYIAGLVNTLARKPGLRARIACDEEEAAEKEYLLSTYANGEFCGGGFHSNPKSSLCDGYLDTLFVNNITRRRFLCMVGDYKKGTHLSPKFDKILKNQKLRQVDLCFESTTNVSVDGEVLPFDELHLSIAEKALRFLVPKGSSFKNMTVAEEEKIPAVVGTL